VTVLKCCRLPWCVASRGFVSDSWATCLNNVTYAYHTCRFQSPSPALFVCLVSRDLDLWPFDPKINGFPGLTVEHFYVKFGDPSFSGFWDIMRKTDRQTRQTDRQTNAAENLPPRLPSVFVNTSIDEADVPEIYWYNVTAVCRLAHPARIFLYNDKVRKTNFAKKLFKLFCIAYI